MGWLLSAAQNPIINAQTIAPIGGGQTSMMNLPPIFRSARIAVGANPGQNFKIGMFIPNPTGGLAIPYGETYTLQMGDGGAVGTVDNVWLAIPLQPIGQTMGFEISLNCKGIIYLSTEELDRPFIPFPYFLGYEVPKASTSESKVSLTAQNTPLQLIAAPPFGAWYLFNWDVYFPSSAAASVDLEQHAAGDFARQYFANGAGMAGIQLNRHRVTFRVDANQPDTNQNGVQVLLRYALGP